MINVTREIENIIQLAKDGYRDITGDLDHLKHRLLKEGQWEEIPDEDLWEDGEMSKKDVKEEIFWRVITMGDWILIRRIK